MDLFPEHACIALQRLQKSVLKRRLNGSQRSMVQVAQDWVILDEDGKESPDSFRSPEGELQPRSGSFDALLIRSVIDIDELRKLGWEGIPMFARPLAWKLLLGYLPPEVNLHESTLNLKRKHYRELAAQIYDEVPTPDDVVLLNQIRLDVPRTIPRGLDHIEVFSSGILHLSLERILYVFAKSHPRTGYLQGLNDLPMQFILVFLSAYVPGQSLDSIDIANLNGVMLSEIEADAYWCLRLMMEDSSEYFVNFTDETYKMMKRLERLVQLKNGPLVAKLQQQNCDFVIFALRWMICLMIREFPLDIGFRLWDSYLSYGKGFRTLHNYVAAALLTTDSWAEILMRNEFSEVIVFLQRLPTDDWGIFELDDLLGRAYAIYELARNAPPVLQNKEEAPAMDRSEVVIRPNFSTPSVKAMKSPIKFLSDNSPTTPEKLVLDPPEKKSPVDDIFGKIRRIPIVKFVGRGVEMVEQKMEAMPQFVGQLFLPRVEKVVEERVPDGADDIKPKEHNDVIKSTKDDSISEPDSDSTPAFTEIEKNELFQPDPMVATAILVFMSVVMLFLQILVLIMVVLIGIIIAFILSKQPT